MRTRRSPTLSTMRVPDKVPTVIEAFEDRLYTLISHANDRLDEVEYLAGDISVADLSFYPYVALRKPLLEARALLPNLERWAALMAARPGVAKGMAAVN